MQQGGAPSVFAPNPQPYRAPLQGLNPNVFQYDVRTQPLDTSNLIQVMQTKDTMDIRREQAALEREKMKADADLAKMKLEHQKAKAQSDFSLEMMKNNFSKFSGISNPIPFEDYTMSNRYKSQYEPLVNAMKAEEQSLVDIVATTPYGDPMLVNKMKDKKDKIESLYKRIVPLEWFKVDQAGRDKINQIRTSEKGDLRVYEPSIMRLEDRRQRYLNDMEENNYKMDYATDPTIWFNEKSEAKKLKDAIDFVNTPRKTTDFGDLIIDKYNQFIKVTKEDVVPKPELAADLLAQKILSDPKQTSYVSTLYGLDLHDPSISPEDKKKALIGLIKPELDFADKILSSVENAGESYLTKVDTPDRPKEATKHVIEVSGGTTKTKAGGYNSTYTRKNEGGTSTEMSQAQDYVNTRKGDEAKAEAQVLFNHFQAEMEKDPIVAKIVRDNIQANNFNIPLVESAIKEAKRRAEADKTPEQRLKDAQDKFNRAMKGLEGVTGQATPTKKATPTNKPSAAPTKKKNPFTGK